MLRRKDWAHENESITNNSVAETEKEVGDLCSERLYYPFEEVNRVDSGGALSMDCYSSKNLKRVHPPWAYVAEVFIEFDKQ
jgi:hypothetical protein